MTLATLSEVLQPALRCGYAVAGLVVLGWEDARAYVAAAEAEGAPLILQAGPGCRAYTPLPVLAAMFRHLAEAATVPVVAHLDHGYSADDCRAAIDCGFSSVMFDGSQLPLDENIAQTRAIAEIAHGAGVSLEGEIGFVGYAAGAASHGTDPDEARLFAQETGVDAMAISIGNVHLQEAQGAAINMDLLRAIEAVTDVPLVLHGSSGIPDVTRRDLALTSKICKFNVGTELRQVFGASLRQQLAQNPGGFDRIEILSAVETPLTDAARKVIRTIFRAS